MHSILNDLPVHREGRLSLAWRRWQLQNRFYRRFGRYIDFDTPDTVHEKVQYRKLFGNHSLYAFLADKYGVRQFVRERVGEEILIPLLGVHERLTEQAFDGLPDKFIIKASHGCKWNQIVKDRSNLDLNLTCRQFNQYLRRNYGSDSGEFHYSLIPPRIVMETLLEERGDSPPDYNFFCFNNDQGFDYALSVTLPRRERFVHFDKNWYPYDGSCTAEDIERIRKPQQFDRMLEIAAALSAGFDFIRVDLYTVGSAIYFGELTSTPASGLRPIANPYRASLLNEQWKLDRTNPLLYQQRAAA